MSRITPIRRPELVVYCLVGLAVAVLNARRAGGGYFSNDSYQYLSAAANIAEAGRVATSIIHYDVERLSGQIPAPLTTFPAGYPLVIAALHRLGLDLETAGVLCSEVSFALLIPIFVRTGRLLALTDNQVRIAVALLLGNAAAGVYASSLLSESLFTAISLGALSELMRHEHDREQPGAGVKHLVVGHLLLGLGYWVRYAGLFLLAVVVAFYAGRLASRRDRRSLRELVPAAVSVALVAAGAIRNIVLTGTWRGGNTKHMALGLVPTLKELVQAVAHVVFSGVSKARVGLAEALLVVGVALVVAQLALRRRAFVDALRSSAPPASVQLLVSYAVVYTATMTYVRMSSPINFDERLLYPILPLMLLIAVAALSWARPALRSPSARFPALDAALALMAAGYLLLNSRRLLDPPAPAPHQQIEAKLAQPMADGTPLRAWFDATVPADAVIVATDAQTTGYAVRRKTVSLVEAAISDATWEDRELHALLRSTGAEFLVLYPGATVWAVPTQYESRLLAGLLAGQVPPWLTLAAENRDVKVFRLTSRDGA